MNSLTYCNGNWMPRADYIDDLALWRANGILVVIEARRKQMFHWDLHYERLIRACKDYGIPVTEPEFPSFEDVVKHATMLLYFSLDESLVMMLASKGKSKNLKVADGQPTFTLKINPLTKRNPAPFNLVIKNFTRPLPDIKLTAGYGFGSAFIEEAQLAGYDSCLYRDDRYGIAECPFENIFFVTQDGVLITPRHNMLPGVTRKIVMDLAKQSGIFKDVLERSVHVYQLHESLCREAFLTSTTLGVAPVASITSSGGAVYSFRVSPENTYTQTLKEKFLSYREEYYK
ncbi:MAG: aminotransferase class IV [bacterium]|nr:aminotransferase class IV [bacterium]